MIRNFWGLALLLALADGAGVIGVVQPELTEQDYRTTASFQLALEPYFWQLAARSSGAEGRLLVFPEYIGTWLVAVHANDRVFAARDANLAMLWIIIAHPLGFLKELLYSLVYSDFEAPLMGHVKRALFRTRAQAMWQAYDTVFSRLSRSYRCWVVAGSITLPQARLEAGRVVFSDAEGRPHRNLLNQSFVYNPEGEVVLISGKVYPLLEELTFMDAARLGDLSTVETGLGRLGVLVCADSWYPEPYQILEQQDVDIICVPSFVTPAERWLEPWDGYDPPGREPAGIDSALIHTAPEREVWEKYAVCGRMGTTGARVGFNSFLIGDFWGMTGSGQSTVSRAGKVVRRLEHPRRSGILFYRMEAL